MSTAAWVVAWIIITGVAAILAGPGIADAVRWVRARRAAAAAGPAPGPAARPQDIPAGPALTAAEDQWLTRYEAWIAGHQAAGDVAGNGQQIADALRQALPDAADVDLARMLIAALITQRAFRAYRDPRTVWAEALGAAALDLASLERSPL